MSTPRAEHRVSAEAIQCQGGHSEFQGHSGWGQTTGPRGASPAQGRHNWGTGDTAQLTGTRDRCRVSTSTPTRAAGETFRSALHPGENEDNPSQSSRHVAGDCSRPRSTVVISPPQRTCWERGRHSKSTDTSIWKQADISGQGRHAWEGVVPGQLGHT